MWRRSLQSTLSFSGFKLTRADQQRGVDVPRHSIACLESGSSLLVADFIINQYPTKAIIDSGATASFLAKDSSLARNCSHTIRSIKTSVKTAGETEINLKEALDIIITPRSCCGGPVKSQLLLLPDCETILGHPVILGLDLIKKLNIKLEQVDGSYRAFVNEQCIGTEQAVETKPLLSLTSNSSNQTDLEIQALVEAYDDIFSEVATTLIRTEPMEIELESNQLVKAKLRRMSTEDILEMYSQVQRMLQNDIIEPSKSSYSSNAHLVPKKNGQKRLVINFIPLNSIAVKDHYPMPQLNDLFQALYGARYYAALDCTEGFLQIPVLNEHRERTAFITPHGLYHFKRCPFGFTNSPATFQRTMNNIFEEGLYKRCVIYIDDILVFGETVERLKENLHWVFQKCRLYCVKLKKSKCKFISNEADFLGFKVANNTLAPIKGKFDPVMIKKPSSRTEILSVLGALNYYSRFIPRYATRTLELRKLTRKDVFFEWTKSHSKLLEELQEELIKALPHKIPDTYSPKVVDIETGDCSIEVICRTEADEIACRAGTILSSSQVNYTPVEKHLLAITLAYEKFGPFLRGPVVFLAACKALVNSLSLKDRPDRVNRLLLNLPPDAEFDVRLKPEEVSIESLSLVEEPPEEVFYTDGACMGNGRADCKASWAVLAIYRPHLSCSGLLDHHRPTNQLAEIKAAVEAFKIADREGFKRITLVSDSKYVTDAMNKWIDLWKANGWKDSRGKQVVNESYLRELGEWKDKLNIKCLHVKGHSLDQNNDKVDKMAKDQLESSLDACLLMASKPLVSQHGDPEVMNIRNKLTECPDLRDRYVIIEDQLYYLDPNLPANSRARLYVPANDRRLLLKVAHDDPIYGGHLGHKKTKSKLAGYYWPKMGTEIESYIQSCQVCQHHKAPKKGKYGLLQPIKTSQVFERLHIDVVGPIKPSSAGNRFIITAIDAFSRFAYARARKEVKTRDIIDFLTEEIITKHGLPVYLVSDNGPQFRSNQFKEIMNDLGIKHTFTCPYHPSANGMDERLNGSLVKVLRNYISHNQRDWDLKLPWALMVYNTAINETTKTSPYTALFGVAPRTPLTQPRPAPSAIKVLEPLEPNPHQDVRITMHNNVDENREAQRRQYDAKRQKPDFCQFDMVMVRTNIIPRGESRKLYPSWQGPFMILRLIGDEDHPVAAEVLNVNKMTTHKVPFQDMKPLYERVEREQNDGINKELLPGEAIQKCITKPSRNNYDHYEWCKRSESPMSVMSDTSSTEEKDEPNMVPVNVKSNICDLRTKVTEEPQQNRTANLHCRSGPSTSHQGMENQETYRDRLSSGDNFVMESTRIEEPRSSSPAFEVYADAFDQLPSEGINNILDRPRRDHIPFTNQMLNRPRRDHSSIINQMHNRPRRDHISSVNNPEVIELEESISPPVAQISRPRERDELQMSGQGVSCQIPVFPWTLQMAGAPRGPVTAGMGWLSRPISARRLNRLNSYAARPIRPRRNVRPPERYGNPSNE